MTAYIGYKNLFDSATVITESNEVTGFEVENAYDWKLFDFWKPGVTGTQTIILTFGSAVSADYFALYGHNLGGEGVTVKLEHSSTGVGGPWTTVVTSTPTDNEIIFDDFTSASKQYWQIELTNCTVDAKIAMITFGEITQLPDSLRWPFIPGLYQQYETDINLSQSGLPLGNTIKRKPLAFNLDQSFLTLSEVTTTMQPIIKHLETTPGAFFIWDLTRPSETLYIYPQAKQKMPGYTHHGFLKSVIGLNGIRD